MTVSFATTMRRGLTGVLTAGLLALAPAGPTPAAAAEPAPAAAGHAAGVAADGVRPSPDQGLPQVRPHGRPGRSGSNQLNATCSRASATTPTTSTCWSGYVKEGTGFRTISASWTVPTVSASSSTTHSSTWVGIDGWSNQSLIQGGTAQIWNSLERRGIYYAWWQTFPGSEIPVFNVSPGDAMTASVSQLSGNQWEVLLVDHTNGRSFSTVQTYSGPQTSAEFIHEAPTVGGNVVPLAPFSDFAFYNTMINGFGASLLPHQRVTMVQNNVTVATASVANEAQNAFTMANGGEQRPPRTPVFQQRADGSIWVLQCPDNSCAGWVQIDAGRGGAQISAGAGTLFVRRSDGSIWRWTGTPCRSLACSGWAQLDSNPRTTSISAGAGTVYQLHSDGSVWRFTGRPCNGASNCPSWSRLDNNAGTRSISAGSYTVYQLRADGSILRWNGNGWTLLDNNPGARSISAAAGTVYQLRADGSVWRSTDLSCGCLGWTKLDNNPATRAIAGGSSTAVYQLHANGAIWSSNGSGCSGSFCPGWNLLDNNRATAAIAASSSTVYQLHTNGTVWSSTGAPCNSPTSCPGWAPIDTNPSTRAIAVLKGF